MAKLHLIKVTIVALIASMVSVSCKKEVYLTEQDVKDILLNSQKVVPLAAEKDDKTITSKDSVGFRYTYEKHDVVDNIESIVYLGLNDDVIWPGNLVKGDKAHDFVYEPISADRAPVTLSISLESSSSGSSIVQEVNDPKLSTIRQGISDLLKKAIISDTKVPAKAEFTYQQMHSKSQMNLFVQADISYGAGSLSTQFNWDQVSAKTRIMAKYRQIYYSIDIDVPKSPLDFFNPAMSKEELAAALPAGSCPLYVAGVTYGWMAIMCIETDFSFEEMSLALQASYKGVVDADLGFGYTAREVMAKSSIKIIIYGGSTAGLGDIDTGFDGFMNVVKTSKEFSKDSPGVPLSYKFRNLVDNTLALVTLTSQYTLVSPLQIQQFVKVNVTSFVCTFADDEGAYDEVDMDRFYVKAYAYNRANSTAPYEQIGGEWLVFSYEGPEIIMHHEGPGYDPSAIKTYFCSGSMILTFDTENHNFSFSKLRLLAQARDKDPTGDDWGSGEITLIGNDIWGAKKITINSGGNFSFDVNVTITKENK